jgi:hypothetical protein
MSGKHKGVQAEIQKLYPKVIYLHCSSHVLNLALNHACDIPIIQNAHSQLREVFPNITTLMKIFATLPVSTATAERSFSTLRRLKTYLRTSMGEDRLNGLALMSIHRNIAGNIDPLDVIDRLAKPRRLDIVI